MLKIYAIVLILLYIFFCLYSNSTYMETVTKKPFSMKNFIEDVSDPSAPSYKYAVFYNPFAIKNNYLVNRGTGDIN